MSEQKSKKELTADDIVSKTPIAFNMKTVIGEAMKILIESKVSGAPVVDQNNSLLSVVSEFDLMKFAAAGLMQQQLLHVLDQLPKKLVTVSKEDKLVDIFKVFLARKVRRVIVVDGMSKLVGVISRRDLLAIFYKDFDNE